MPDPARPGRVLVVDDEPDVRALVAAAVRVGGWEPVEAATSAEALAVVAAGGIAAITLDINLGPDSGYDTCRAIRATSTVPILFLTARSDEFDHVLGLELGADDFLVKPFSPRVLVARLGAVIRRATTADGGVGGLLRVRNVSLDPVSRRVRAGATELDLSKMEFDLLATFMGEPARAFDRDALLDRVWGSWYGDDHVVDVTLGRLRRKLAVAGAPDLIETLRGVGYRLADS